MRKRPRTAHGPPPIAPARRIKPLIRLLLCVRAGGRCEFDGCNTFLFEHHLTLTEGVFGENAHIVAFQPEGPRGKTKDRPPDINSISNLMLLCPTCHKLIDDEPDKYTRQALETYKTNHEQRIKYLTDLGPDRKTTVVIVKAPIAGQQVSIPIDQIIEATSPRYPSSRDAKTIDLSQITDSGSGFVLAAVETIAEKMRRFFEPGGEGAKAQHISVFALAPIPLLIFLGRQSTNKIPSDVYQRHRDTENWTWKRRGTPVRYSFSQRRVGPRKRVALLLSLSGPIPLRSLPTDLLREATIYELTLQGQKPRPTFLRLSQDLRNFRSSYQQAISEIIARHGLVDQIELFPAVPAPVAVLCGRELLPKVHPRLKVYDYDKTKGGFKFIIEV